MKLCKYITGIIFLSVVFLSSCNKESFITDTSAKLSFSDDTVTFDTVFSGFGTITYYLKVYNNHNRAIQVSSIYLAGRENSVFRINVDGSQGYSFKDVEIPANDSIFILVEATLDNSGGNLPLYINDSIVFISNTNMQRIILEAWGQDVYFQNGNTISTNTIWTPDKPYLIHYNCVVDSGVTLTIQSGTKVHLHKYSSLVVLGTLKVQGTKDDPVVFQGDRLEDLYDDIPGQWGTIALIGSNTESVIEYAEIKNAIAGFQIGLHDTSLNVNASIINTRIYNMSGAGIYSYGSSVKAYNTTIFNTGSAALALLKGGNYGFYHCTFAEIANKYVSNSDPAIIVSNYFRYYQENSTTGEAELIEVGGDLTEAVFGNCIIYGNKENELLIANDKKHQFEYFFDHCLMKISTDTFNVFSDTEHFVNNIYNKNPKFKNITKNDYQLDTLSPAKDNASAYYVNLFPQLLYYDYNGNSRGTDTGPDIGAYERKD